MSNMQSLEKMQREFAAHLRDPSNNPAPSQIEERRMKIYRELFYNNIEGFIASAFPVLRTISSDEKWHRLVRGFFADYYCRSPYFLEISQEFLDYLQHSRPSEPDDFVFMLELAHYEWIELAVDVDTEEFPRTGFNPQGNLMQGRPFVSPLAHVLSYQFPVHRIGPAYLPDQVPPNATFLIVYRDEKYDVRFMEINSVTARLLLILDENPEFNGEQAVMQIVDEMQHPDPKVVLDGGRQALMQLYQSGVILGTELTPL